MSLRSYIILMLITTIACYMALFGVISFYDPLAGGVLVMIFFYASLFLALVGTFSLLGLLFRLITTRDKLVFKKVIISFRQSIWFSLLVIISLQLKLMDLLIGRNLIFLVFAFALLELFFLSYKKNPSLKI